MPKPPDAFLSYTRSDDRRDSKKISQFRKELAEEVPAATGADSFEIFQDIDGIGLGEPWAAKLTETLTDARFFIPILTPSYFRSGACRDELQRFLKAEEEAGRNDLILPILWRPCDVLENDEMRATDPLAMLLASRQQWDWSDLRTRPFGDRKVKLALEALAKQIDGARRRVARAAGSQPTTGGPAKTKRRSRQSTKAPRARRRTTMPPPGTVFRDIDAPWCPEMVVIPPGEFTMGSTGAEKESPQHLVRIAYPLAVGRYPVTFEQYGPFPNGRNPRDNGWGRGRRPVINVSWDDARAYAEWFSLQTGQRYRLLSEAEWEYACRAGTTTRHWWGDEITRENANYGKILGRTCEVGSYPANPFGLYDTQGNVWEWVEDRWHESYNGAPENGSAWTAGNDSRRVVRGGSWGNSPGVLRSALRVRYDTSYRGAGVGFRIARTFMAQPAVSPVKDTHWNKLEYHDPDLTGRVTFNYSNNNGRYSIGTDEFFFETRWSKASDRSIHLLNDPPSIVGVAEAPELRSYRDVIDPASYDMSSRVRTIQKGEHAILKNRQGRYVVIKVLDVKDRTRSDAVDELTFEFWILSDTT